jgi:hypothetical protein
MDKTELGKSWRTITERTEQMKQVALDEIFTYHAPKGDQPKRYELLRNSGKSLAALIIQNCPESEERGLALDKLRETIMWANASIAVGESVK